MNVSHKPSKDSPSPVTSAATLTSSKTTKPVLEGCLIECTPVPEPDPIHKPIPSASRK